MEQEGVDEFPHYYYTGNGQFYNTQMVRSLSEVGQTGTSGPGGGPAGNAIAPPSGGGNGSFGHWYVNNVLDPSSTGNPLGNLPDIGFSSEAGSFVIPLGTIAQIIEEWVSFFEWLFGGGGTPEIPRQLLHNRHPLYPVTLGVPDGVIPDGASAAPASCSADPYATADDAVRAVAPLANKMSANSGNECGGAIVSTPEGYAYTGPVDVGSPCGGHLSLPAGYVGSYHTHPATCSSGVPSEASQADLDFAAQSKAPVYFITPDGKIYKIQPGGPVVPLQK